MILKRLHLLLIALVKSISYFKYCFHDEDLNNVYDFIKAVVDAGIDAFIVSDPFIIKYIKDNFNVEVHLSTQGSTTNLEAVRYWKSEGIDRVVLAREVSIKEIKEISENVDVDLEVFIHGAMCTFIVVDAVYLIILLIEILIVVDVHKFVGLHLTLIMIQSLQWLQKT